jgi:hypothetical protein
MPRFRRATIRAKPNNWTRKTHTQQLGDLRSSPPGHPGTGTPRQQGPPQAQCNRGSTESDAGDATRVIASHLAVPGKCSRRTRVSVNRINYAGASRRCESENAGIRTYLSRSKTDDFREASVHFRDKCLSHF